MLVVFGPTFFGGKDPFTCDVCTWVIFFSEALRDLEARFVVVPVGARLLVALGVHSIFFRLGIVMPICSCYRGGKARRVHRGEIEN